MIKIIVIIITYGILNRYFFFPRIFILNISLVNIDNPIDASIINDIDAKTSNLIKAELT